MAELVAHGKGDAFRGLPGSEISYKATDDGYLLCRSAPKLGSIYWAITDKQVDELICLFKTIRELGL